MGTFEQIRKISPYAFLIFGIMLVLFFTIGDPTVVDGIVGTGTGQGQAIGKVNGKEIFYKDFEDQVKQQVEQQRQQMEAMGQPVNETMIRTQVWSQMIEDILVAEKAEELGIVVTDEEIADILIENPPQFLKNSFTDSTGAFNKQMYLELITNPENYVNYLGADPSQIPAEDKQKAVESFRNDLLLIEDFLRKQKITELLTSTVNSAGTIISPSFAKIKYSMENSYSDFSYISFRVSDVVDETKIEIPEEKIKTYYDKNKSYMKQKEARKIKYLSIPMQPSSDDSSKVVRRVEIIMDNVKSATSQESLDSVFDVRMSEYGGDSYDFQNTEQIDKSKYSYMALLPVGQVAGPVQLRDGTYFFRLDGRREGNETLIKASHILVNFGNDKDSAMTEARDLLKRAKSGENFAELAMKFSEDKGSGARGGDLGYFGKGQMVPAFEEACFAANEGDIIGPIESRFGYHIINVVDKTSDEIAFSEIKLTTTISGITKNKLFMEAKSIAEQVREGESLDSLGSKLGYNVVESSFFERERPVLGSRYLASLAFEAEKGDILPIDEIGDQGIVVAQVVDSRTKGVMTYEDAKPTIRKKLAREMQIDEMKERATETYNRIIQYGSLAEAQVSDPTLDVKIVSNVKGDGNISGFGKDLKFVSSLSKLPENQISEPVRGDLGYYIVEMKFKSIPTNEALEQTLPNYIKTLRDNSLSNTYSMWYRQLVEDAEIEDYRNKFFKEF